MKRGQLRLGYTTGACAAAAAKAATMLLLGAGVYNSTPPQKIEDFLGTLTTALPCCSEVEIPFPDGSRVIFKVHNSELTTHNSQLIAVTSVIKDAGDDPDVTNGAEIRAEVRMCKRAEERKNRRTEVKDFQASELSGFQAPGLIIKGGNGVGIVTKPGLSVPAGEAAINPVPRKMIQKAVMEVILQNPEHRRQRTKDRGQKTDSDLSSAIKITISVPEGEKLAKKTLNHRLGIVGGISILGTTGIVSPISSEAWTATITSSMDVARAMGHDEIVLSAGRASEKAHMNRYNFPEEVYVMMGDYLEFALIEAKRHEFKKIHLCAQWAKMLKIAMSTPQTHVRHGALDVKKAINFLKNLSSDFCFRTPLERDFLTWLTSDFNTAREIFDYINSSAYQPIFLMVCSAARRYAENIAAGVPVTAYLVSYEGNIIQKADDRRQKTENR
jgi:cobalt-precorrin-5B (C1)-methyltransferase